MFDLSSFDELMLMYVLFHVFLVVLSVFTFAKLGKDIVTIQEASFFRFLITMFIIYVVTAVLWSLLENEVISLPHWAFVLNSTLSYVALTLIAFGTFMFMVFRHEMIMAQKRWFWFVSLAPIAIVAVLLFINIFNGMIFTVVPNESGYLHLQNSPFYNIMTFFGMSYFMAIFGMSVVNTFNSASLTRKREYFTLALAMIIIGVVVAIGILFKHLTVLPMAISAAITFIFANLQESGINNDTLTGLNNRRRAREYLAERLAGVSPIQPLFLFICDINFFKDINDEHGHIEGDNALTIVARVAKDVVSEYAGFLARYGGDEFIFSITPSDHKNMEFSPEKVIIDLQKALEDECRKLNKPYVVTISIGYTECNNPALPLSHYITKADNMLYLVKKEYHASVGRE